MLKITAKYADTWNTYGGPGVSAGEAARIVGDRNKMLDELCEQVGRKPEEIRRSLLAYGRVAGTNPFASVDAFTDYVSEFREVGITECVFYYPPQEFYRPSTDEQERVFERVAVEIMPQMRYH
jgi:hypothetical protein